MNREAQSIPPIVLLMANAASLIIAPVFNQVQFNLMLKVKNLKRERSNLGTKILHRESPNMSSKNDAIAQRIDGITAEINSLGKNHHYTIEQAINGNVAREIRAAWQEIINSHGLKTAAPHLIIASMSGSKGEYYPRLNALVLNPFYIADFALWDHKLKGLIGHELMHWHQSFRDPEGLDRSMEVLKRAPDSGAVYTHSGVERQARLMQIVSEIPEPFEGKSFADFVTFLGDSPTFMQAYDSLTEDELSLMIRALYKHYR